MLLSFPFDDIEFVMTNNEKNFSIKLNWYDFSNFVTVSNAPLKTQVTFTFIQNLSTNINKYFNSESPFKPGIMFKRFPFLELNTKYSDSELTVASNLLLNDNFQ